MTKARVFLLEEPRKTMDISAAYLYGELVYLFEPTDRRASVLQPDLYVNDVIEALKRKNFGPDDYFCLTGSSHCLAFTMVALSRLFTYYNILMFNASTQEYVPAEIRA